MTIDKIGNSKYITEFDLLKGFWQIPLTERAKEISAFVTPDELYHYKVMPFGMKNSPATFQCLINTIIAWSSIARLTSMMPIYTMMRGITIWGLSKHSLIK